MAELFEDEHFHAALGSVFYDGREDPGIEWKRPKEICENPVFIDEGATKYDIAQGHLSNCWFLSAAAVLATRRELFNEIVPEGQDFQDNYNGKFRFRFWRYGNWEEVEVDDRLPTKKNKLYFCHNRDNPNEFWSALLEKAYAKVHRSYQALNLGYSQDALIDLTGGIGEFIDLNGSIGVKGIEDGSQREQNINKLFRRMKKLVKKETTLLCSAINVRTEGAEEDILDTGLVTAHAYSICTVTEILVGENPVHLIKVRNPWGWKEWRGAWGDDSSEWDSLTEEQKQELVPVQEDDGVFWMTFEDWVANFDVLNLCHLTPDSVHGPYKESLWQSADYHGLWTPGATAGGCIVNQATYWQNPQYFVRLEDPDDDEDNLCTMVISLMQKYARVRKTAEKREDTELAIGFDLFKYRGRDPEELDDFQASSGSLQIKYPMHDFEFFRERTKRVDLSPGTYCIIPSTYSPDTEGQFLLRLAFEKPTESGEVDTPSGLTDSTGDSGEVGEDFNEWFSKLSGEDQVMDARELKKLLNRALKREQDEEFSKETSRALVKSVLGNHRGTMSKDEVAGIWIKVKNFQESFDNFDQDNSGALDIRELRRALKAAGMTLSKKALSAVAQKYCGKTDQLTLDDYVLVAIKILTTQDAFENARRRSRSGGQKKVALTMDEVLEMAL